jgi:hypothetical protein
MYKVPDVQSAPGRFRYVAPRDIMQLSIDRLGTQTQRLRQA